MFPIVMNCHSCSMTFTGPSALAQGFPAGPPRFLMRPGAPRLLMNIQYRPRGNFRGRPMIPRGLMRTRFHAPAVGMETGNKVLLVDDM